MPAIHASRESLPVFDPAIVRGALRPLEFSDFSVPTTPEQDYFAYYGLDFENRGRGVVHHFGTLDAAGFRIASHLFEPPRPRGTCVLLHGYFDHAGLFGKLIAHCLAKRYAVLVWDLPGHGLSSGPEASIDSFESYVDVLTDVLDHHAPRLPAPLVGIGQSTGGAVLMAWAFRRRRLAAPCPFAGMVLLAPLVRPAEWTKVRVMHTLLKPFRDGIERTFMENSGDPDFLDFVQRDPLQSRRLPVRWVSAMLGWVADFLAEAPATDYAPRVIQGDADQTVDWRWNLARIREKFPAARIEILPGARHHLVNEAAGLRERVFSAMELP